MARDQEEDPPSPVPSDISEDGYEDSHEQDYDEEEEVTEIQEEVVRDFNFGTGYGVDNKIIENQQGGFANGPNEQFGTIGFEKNGRDRKRDQQNRGRRGGRRSNCNFIQSELNDEWQVHPNTDFIRNYQNGSSWIDKLVARREDVKNFDAAIMKLYEETKVTQAEVRAKEKFRKDIQAICKNYDAKLNLNWHCQVFQTGSSISGLAAKGSDVDLCLFIPNGMKNANCPEKTKSFRFLQIVRAAILHEIKCGTFPYTIKDMYLRDASIPLLKIYTKCGIECDLSVCPNRFLSGVHNSLLIKGYTLFDERFAPLAIFVKNWAAVTKLKQPCPPKAKYNSYCLSLLLIHFLQCGVSPPVLPNLRKKCLAQWPDGPEASFYAKSETDFPRVIDITKFPKVECAGERNTMSLTELFARFLQYYCSFDYFEMFISLRESYIEKRSNAKSLNIDIRRTQFCYVQDPIDQHNPARTMYDLGGSLHIFQSSANLFIYASRHSKYFPTVGQFLKKEKLPSRRVRIRRPLAHKKTQRNSFGRRRFMEVLKEQNVIQSLPPLAAIPEEGAS